MGAKKNIDYVCGATADCTPILQIGPCFNPTTVKDHCHYAVNNYFQRKCQITGSSDFSSTTTVSPTFPNAASLGCAYPSSPSNNAGTSTTTPSTTPTIGGTPNTGIPIGPGIGLGPIGSGGFNDNSSSTTVFQSTNLLISLLFSGFLFQRRATNTLIPQLAVKNLH
ncbi:Hypothetical predicted protein [Olea europaea subsp. europaea]|uniref:X8 domain-containing protein n=1 Tax=Olea europaea subsp. europaea TaxID=158383 RepID=A0A8S0S2E5_OLEEU|nr:Hypothetical predicted protein [Olea europaea subsp. europaea]